MLDFLFCLAIFAMFFITVFGIFSFKDKFLKWVCSLAALIVILSLIVALPIYTKVTKEAEISTLEISEIYKNGNEEYCVKLADSESLLKVKIKNVYEGDSNYLIRYHYPKMSKKYEFLLEKEKTSYDLVVTDLNIPILSTID